MDFIFIEVDIQSNLYNFNLTEFSHGLPYSNEFEVVNVVYGNYTNATIFFASRTLDEWLKFATAMFNQGMMSKQCSYNALIAYASMEDRCSCPTPEESMNHVRSRILWETLKEFLQPNPKVRGFSIPKDWYRFQGDVDLLVTAIEGLGLTGVSDKVYDEQLLNRIIDNPFIEKDLQKIWYARPKKELPDASDIRLLEQICFESTFRKWNLLKQITNVRRR